MAISLYWDRDLAKSRNNGSRLGKSPAETANNGVHALLDRDRAKAGDDNGDGLGKIPVETANHGDHAFSHRDRAKSSDNP